MKSGSKFFQSFTVLCTIAILFGCRSQAVDAQYSIASQEYAQLSGKYLQHIANFEWEESYAMLSDDVEFKLPDGDTGSRTSFTGLEEVKAFWNNYVANSGNDKAIFTNFVHVPVEVNQEMETIDMTGAFDLCYFSAELRYGSKTAKVRMHWAIHFNMDKKIDGIYAYYDRTPIIEAAQKNFLGNTDASEISGVVVQTIKIKSSLSEEDLLKIATQRAEKFRSIPGLQQKYYVRHSEPGYYGGVYLWDSKESMAAFMQTELAATMSQAYEIVEGPSVEISDVVYQLRD